MSGAALVTVLAALVLPHLLPGTLVLEPTDRLACRGEQHHQPPQQDPGVGRHPAAELLIPAAPTA